MSWTDTEALVQSLRCYDISLERGTAAIIREDKGLLQPSDWLEFHRIDGTPMGKLLRSEIQVMASLVLDIIFNWSSRHFRYSYGDRARWVAEQN